MSSAFRSAEALERLLFVLAVATLFLVSQGNDNRPRKGTGGGMSRAPSLFDGLGADRPRFLKRIAAMTPTRGLFRMRFVSQLAPCLLFYLMFTHDHRPIHPHLI